jgi:aminopeptidase
MHARTAVAALCLALAFGFAAEAAAQKKAVGKGPDTKAIAAQVVKQIAGVKDGDVVFIEGDLRDFALLEDLWLEVRKQGAAPMVFVGREQANRRYYDEVAEQNDAKPVPAYTKLYQLPTVTIEIQGQEFPGQLNHVPVARFAAMSKAWAPLDQMIVKRNLRRVFLGNFLYPTTATAKQFGMTKDQLAKLFWDGVAGDPAKVAATAEAVRAIVASGKELRLSHANGSDLKMAIAARPIQVSDGTITPAKIKKGGSAAWTWLPAGEVILVPTPRSVEGKLVFDRVLFEDGEILGLTLTFKGGKVTEMTAKPGAKWDRFKARYDAAPARKDEFSNIDFGVNPGVKAPRGSKLLSWVAAGSVALCIGENASYGGDNPVPYSACGFLPGSTVTVDGKPLIEKGELKVPGAGVASK